MSTKGIVSIIVIVVVAVVAIIMAVVLRIIITVIVTVVVINSYTSNTVIRRLNRPGSAPRWRDVHEHASGARKGN